VYFVHPTGLRDWAIGKVGLTIDNRMVDHSDKHIREAVRYAEGRGWRVVKSGGSAHVWGQLFCPEATREGCIIRVFSTPRNRQNHARKIRREVDKCPHGLGAGENDLPPLDNEDQS
jgi:hypothetical protein